MAQFRGVVSGGRGEASRVGHKTSGLIVKANGWSSGVRVEAQYDKENDRDEFLIYATNGSGYGNSGRYIGKVIEGVFHPNGIGGIDTTII